MIKRNAKKVKNRSFCELIQKLEAAIVKSGMTHEQIEDTVGVKHGWLREKLAAEDMKLHDVVKISLACGCLPTIKMSKTTCHDIAADAEFDEHH